MKSEKEEIREKERLENREKWNQELEFWKESDLIVFRKVKYDNDVLNLTYAEFKDLVELKK